MRKPSTFTVAAVVVMGGALTALTLGPADGPGDNGLPGTPTTAPAAFTYQDTTVDGYPTLDTADWGTDIPRCASDDWNSTHLPRCYVESSTSVIVIDQDDNTLATLTR